MFVCQQQLYFSETQRLLQSSLLVIQLITITMLQSLLRLLANEEEESVAAEQLDVSLPTLSWDQLRDVTNQLLWFIFMVF